MSYSKKVIYEVIPEGSYKVIRKCGKCGCKRTYVNTNHFRINANGNQIDVWLIYQCEKCRHTFNLTILERKKPNEIHKEEYQKFLANDNELAKDYGNKKELFAKNKADIDLEKVDYQIKIVGETQQDNHSIVIRNTYEMKLRTERVLVEILGITRSALTKLIEEKKLSDIPKYIGYETEICFIKDII